MKFLRTFLLLEETVMNMELYSESIHVIEIPFRSFAPWINNDWIGKATSDFCVQFISLETLY